MSTLFAIAIFLSSQLVGSEFVYTVQAGDSLRSISARVGSDVRVIADANDLKITALLKPGQLLKIDNRHIVPEFGDGEIIVNLPQRMLFFFRQGQLTYEFPVAAGRATWQTPLGRFEIIKTEEHPTWVVPVSIQAEMRSQGKPVLTRVPPGPDNPLGNYWLGLSLDGVGIHGTNAPSSIYSLQTHGCIRLNPEDIERLFGQVKVGTKGEVIYEPVLLAHIGASVFLEVHPDVYKRAPDSLARLSEIAETSGLSGIIDWTLVKEVIRKRDGIARDVTIFPVRSND